jgi:hypothetical protein
VHPTGARTGDAAREPPASIRTPVLHRAQRGVLAACNQKASGLREAKLERLLCSYVQPSEVLGLVSLVRLREICTLTDLRAPSRSDSRPPAGGALGSG